MKSSGAELTLTVASQFPQPPTLMLERRADLDLTIGDVVVVGAILFGG
jgi:hypothetical protein